MKCAKDSNKHKNLQLTNKNKAIKKNPGQNRIFGCFLEGPAARLHVYRARVPLFERGIADGK